MRLHPFAALAAASLLLITSGCSKTEDTPAPVASEQTAGSAATAPKDLIPYESFELENGLKVIFHHDKSDPVVAVSLTAHVGSAREKPGRTGFAHLFEHLLFLESENLGKGGLDRLSARIGGSGANGSTSRDRTNYLQTVPNDALEKMLWAEADKLGWFINTVTDPVLEKEKQVVKNEKRQRVDNRPYGHEFYVIGKALYPEGHPYNWTVIGSLEDLQAATLEDVKEFFRTWYTPNNVTLVLAGDFDGEQARAWVEKYFAEIPRGQEIVTQPKQPSNLEATVTLFHEDNFANLPQLTMVWPAVPLYHPDSYALEVLSGVLAGSKDSPLHKVLVDEAKLTARVDTFSYTSELSGDLFMQVRGFDGVDLDDVEAALADGFARFESEGVDEDAMLRIKTELEVGFYRSVGTVLGKGVQLARASIFAGDPGYVTEDLSRLQAVTAEDVLRVYNQYIKDKPRVITSFVPQGQVALAVDGSERAMVVEEQIVQGAEAEVDPNVVATYEKTPSRIDRSVEPPYGEPPVISAPEVWQDRLDNGVSVVGIEDNELPVVRMQLRIDGGHLRDTIETAGTANLVAELLTKGTATRSPVELENTLKGLGASIEASADTDAVIVTVDTLARNFDATVDLLAEILLTPRWDATAFDLAKARVTTEIQAAQAEPDDLAAAAYRYVTFGAEDIRAISTRGTLSSVERIELDALKAWGARNIRPEVSAMLVAGDVSRDQVMAAMADLGAQWAATALKPVVNAMPETPEAAKIYFYDLPGAKQSVFQFSTPSLTRTSEDFTAATAMNYRLGGGGFASRLTQEVREGKGYTYRIFSRFEGGKDTGEFTVFSRIRSNATREALVLVRSILEDYADTYNENDLVVTQSYFSKSAARRFESLPAKLRLLANVNEYGLSPNYVADEVAAIQSLGLGDVRDLAGELINPDAMNYVIVGDAASQLDRLGDLGMGAPILVNEVVDAIAR